MEASDRGTCLFAVWFAVALVGIGIGALFVAAGPARDIMSDEGTLLFLRNTFIADIVALPFLWKSHQYAEMGKADFLKWLTTQALKANIAFAAGLLFLSLVLLQQTYHFV